MPESGNGNSSIPFSLVQSQGKESGLSSAVIVFSEKEPIAVNFKNFKFQSGTLEMDPHVFSEKVKDEFKPVSSKNVPYFSISAIIFLIIFRNLFFTRFSKYFLSVSNNYEIDFNFQKIGLIPLIFSISISILVFSEIGINSNEFPSVNQYFSIENLRIATNLLGLPLVVSMIFFFLLNFSSRIFPILFVDIKSFFLLSLIVLFWNFFSFGSYLPQNISQIYFFIGIAVLFLIIRSIYFFKVLLKTYRFRMPISLFYICIFNLGTFLTLYRSLRTDILKLL